MSTGEIEDVVQQMKIMVTRDIEEFAKKAKEYGSADLEVMGAAMDELLDTTDGVEAALAFYLLGKIARAFGALKMGRLPSDDTWHDVTVYSLMIRERRMRTDV